MTEDELLEAIRSAVAARPASDPGLTVIELAQAIYGNPTTYRRGLVAKALGHLMAAGRMRRGYRSYERVDGKFGQVAVFRAAA